ncbi:MAG: hypothetical protein ACI4UV_15735 [Victivallales bacterium]
MKKITSLALALLASLSLIASVSADETKKNLLANGGFEQDGIRYPNDDVANVRRAAKFGRNDGIGLRLICNEKTHKILTYLKVSSPLEADKTYRAGCWVRVAGAALPIVCVESYSKGKPAKYQGGYYTIRRTNRIENGWVYYTGTFTIKEKDPAFCEYRVFLGAQCPSTNKGGGEIFFDDVEIFEESGNTVAK